MDNVARDKTDCGEGYVVACIPTDTAVRLVGILRLSGVLYFDTTTKKDTIDKKTK